MPTNTFTTNDTFTWKDGVTKATVKARGEGGNGTNSYGGGGGAYAEDLVNRSGAASDTVQVGQGGSQTNSFFRDDTTVMAVYGDSAGGASPGAGGLAANCIGTTKFSGGNGGTSADSPDTGGGGGGGGAGDAGDGSNGEDGTDIAGAGGAGGSAGGGNGGNANTENNDGFPGSAPGGGGGGGGTSGNGAAGGRGEVVVITVPGHLNIIQQPTDANSGATISPAITVEILDSDNNRDTNASGNITVAIFSGSGALNGTLVVAASSGLATFSNVNIVGSGAHTLIFTHADCTSATSDSFNILRKARLLFHRARRFVRQRFA